MNQFATLIATAMLAVGIAAAGLTAPVSKAAAPMAADAPASAAFATYAPKPPKHHRTYKKVAASAAST